MRKETWMIGLMAGAGIVLISIYADWWVALGVFLMIWANNIDQRTNKEHRP